MKSPIDDDFALPEGEWRLDPVRRVRVWVPRVVTESPDAFDETAHLRAPTECACGAKKRSISKTCMECYRASVRPTPRILKKILPPAESRGPDCGSTRGYRTHRKNAETTCQPCRDAMWAYSRKRQDKK